MLSLSSCSRDDKAPGSKVTKAFEYKCKKSTPQLSYTPILPYDKYTEGDVKVVPFRMAVTGEASVDVAVQLEVLVLFEVPQ